MIRDEATGALQSVTTIKSGYDKIDNNDGNVGINAIINAIAYLSVSQGTVINQTNRKFRI